MNADRRLTQFQRDCDAAVTAATEAIGLSIESRELLGEIEAYVRATVPRTGIVLYIYEDEAQIHGQAGLRGLYEAQNYPSGGKLQLAFDNAVIGAVGDRLPPD